MEHADPKEQSNSVMHPTALRAAGDYHVRQTEFDVAE